MAKAKNEKSTIEFKGNTPLEIQGGADLGTYSIGNMEFRLAKSSEITGERYDLARPIMKKMEAGQSVSITDYSYMEYVDICSAMVYCVERDMNIEQIKSHFKNWLSPDMATQVVNHFFVSNASWLMQSQIFSQMIREALQEQIREQTGNITK